MDLGQRNYLGVTWRRKIIWIISDVASDVTPSQFHPALKEPAQMYCAPMPQRGKNGTLDLIPGNRTEERRAAPPEVRRPTQTTLVYVPG